MPMNVIIGSFFSEVIMTVRGAPPSTHKPPESPHKPPEGGGKPPEGGGKPPEGGGKPPAGGGTPPTEPKKPPIDNNKGKADGSGIDLSQPPPTDTKSDAYQGWMLVKQMDQQHKADMQAIKQEMASMIAQIKQEMGDAANTGSNWV
jgi:hypothetical protein